MQELTDDQVAAIHQPYLKRGRAGHMAFARAVIAADRALQNNAWRKAIDDARLSLMLDITAPDANPAASVKELVSWANELALNPAISSEAQALIDRGLAMQAERHREELLAYEVTVGNLRALREQAQPVPCPDNPAWHYERLDRLLSMTLSAESYEDYLYSLNIVAAPQAQPERKPMTDAEIEKARNATFSTGNPYCPVGSKSMLKAARAVEAFHDVKEADIDAAIQRAAPQAQPEQPRKERPDFIAGYMAGMADGKALRAQTERERAAKVCDDMKKAFVTAKFPTDYECSAAMNAAMKCATKIRELK